MQNLVKQHLYALVTGAALVHNTPPPVRQCDDVLRAIGRMVATGRNPLLQCPLIPDGLD
jgi:hypothetical protein